MLVAESNPEENNVDMEAQNEPFLEHDPTNQPVRRMRTSLVNRRRLADMHERETCRKYLWKHVGDLIF